MSAWVRKNCRFATGLRDWGDPMESDWERGSDWPATDQESDQQEARILGSEHPERPWILTDRDVWHQNPFYKGPPVPHPEASDEPPYDPNEEFQQEPEPLKKSPRIEPIDDKLPF